ncbi:MAG: rod shape-determining protein RodA [Deltaproteobacteria bacterium]|nr:rod shape-determining protein RodA [Deltaproteobacteria bacterium]
MESQNFIKTFNLGLIISMFLLFLLGVITLYSAARGPGLYGLYKSQLIYFSIGLVLISILVFVDSEMLQKVSYLSYAVVLIMLGLVLVVGHESKGSSRWFNLGFFHLQPSELAKVSIVMTLAKYFSDEKLGGPYTLRRLWIPLVLILPYFLLILKQPDMGTGGIVFLTAGLLILFVKVDWRSLLIVGILGVITVPLAYEFVMHDYQRERVKTFLDPERDPRDTGYNALQCKIAVGSGKFFGKGYLKGTQSQLNFIPEQQTDFIFSVFAEERGFMGALILLALYGSYCFYSFRTVARARGKYEMLLAFGLTSIMFWHVFINIGMVIGVLPIVGVTLPFFSYGGSSLITFMLITGLLLNISRKRYIF